MKRLGDVFFSLFAVVCLMIPVLLSASGPHSGAPPVSVDLASTSGSRTALVAYMQQEDSPATDDSADESPLLALLGMAAAVAAAVEFLKSFYLKRVKESAGLSENAYAALVQAVAFAASLVLVFATSTTPIIFDVLGVYPGVDRTFGLVVTALAVSFGEGFLHGVSDFFGKRPRVTLGTIEAVSTGYVQRE